MASAWATPVVADLLLDEFDEIDVSPAWFRAKESCCEWYRRFSIDRPKTQDFRNRLAAVAAHGRASDVRVCAKGYSLGHYGRLIVCRAIRAALERDRVDVAEFLRTAFEWRITVRDLEVPHPGCPKPGLAVRLSTAWNRTATLRWILEHGYDRSESVFRYDDAVRHATAIDNVEARRLLRGETERAPTARRPTPHRRSAWAAPVVADLLLDEFASEAHAFVGMALAHDEWRLGLDRHRPPFRNEWHRQEALNALARHGDVDLVRWFLDGFAERLSCHGTPKFNVTQATVEALSRDRLDVAEFFLELERTDRAFCAPAQGISTAWTRLATLQWIRDRIGRCGLPEVALEHACFLRNETAAEWILDGNFGGLPATVDAAWSENRGVLESALGVACLDGNRALADRIRARFEFSRNDLVVVHRSVEPFFHAHPHAISPIDLLPRERTKSRRRRQRVLRSR